MVRRGKNDHTYMTVEFECCGRSVSQELVLHPDQTMLGNASLIDQMLVMMDAVHAAEHPECALVGAL